MLGGVGGKANRGIYTEVILEIEWAIRNFSCGVWEWHEIRCASLEVSNNGAGTATSQKPE